MKKELAFGHSLIEIIKNVFNWQKSADMME